MDTQQMSEPLLAMPEIMRERMDAKTKAINENMNELKKDGKIDKEEIIARMDAKKEPR
jgi:hypothetical protein